MKKSVLNLKNKTVGDIELNLPLLDMQHIEEHNIPIQIEQAMVLDL